MAKEKKGLGTGLGALFGEDIFESGNQEQLLLPIEKIEPRLEQPREFFDEESLNELADSIGRFGVIQPIVVRQLDNGYYQIIAGERRWRAARLAGLSEIPARIIEADDRRCSEITLVENLQREDLNPMEEARGYKTLMEDYGLTQEETAKSVGKSRSAIANTMRLLSLSAEVIKLVEKGELSAGHARTLVTISDSGQQLDAANEIIKKSLSVRKAEQLAARLSSEKKSSDIKYAHSDGVDYAAEISAQMSEALGRRVKLRDGKKTGKIEIDFYGADDREELIEQLLNLKKRGE